MNLKTGNARGRCYDGASEMTGSKFGCATQLKLLNRKCIFTHYY